MDKKITFNCMFLECGRKFETQDILKKHEERRHPDYFKDRYPEDNKNKNVSEKKSKNILQDLENKIKVIENTSISQKANLKNLENDDDNNNIELQTSVELNMEEGLQELDNYNATEILADDSDEEENDYITDEMLMIGGKYADYEEVDEVNFLIFLFLLNFFRLI